VNLNIRYVKSTVGTRRGVTISSRVHTRTFRAHTRTFRLSTIHNRIYNVNKSSEPAQSGCPQVDLVYSLYNNTLYYIVRGSLSVSLFVTSVWAVSSLENVMIEEGMSESLGARQPLFGIVLEQPLHQVEYLLQLC